MSYLYIAFTLLLASPPALAQVESAVQRQSTSYSAASGFDASAREFIKTRTPVESDVLGTWVLIGTDRKTKSTLRPDGIRTRTGDVAQTITFGGNQVNFKTLAGVTDPEDTKTVSSCSRGGRTYLCFRYADSDYACGLAKDGDLLCRTLQWDLGSVGYRRYRNENKILAQGAK